jgi:hypothetical protein
MLLPGLVSFAFCKCQMQTNLTFILVFSLVLFSCTQLFLHEFEAGTMSQSKINLHTNSGSLLCLRGLFRRLVRGLFTTPDELLWYLLDVHTFRIRSFPDHPILVSTRMQYPSSSVDILHIAKLNRDISSLFSSSMERQRRFLDCISVLKIKDQYWQLEILLFVY